MTNPYGTALIYEALSRVCANVAGVRIVMGVNLGTAQSPVVVPIADELPDLPAICLWPGPWEIIPGSWRRDTHTVRGVIVVGREAPGDGVTTLLGLFDDLGTALMARAKAYDAEPALQSVLMTRGDGLTEVEWPRESNAWLLAWPFELEVKVNVAVVYQAQ